MPSTSRCMSVLCVAHSRKDVNPSSLLFLNLPDWFAEVPFHFVMIFDDVCSEESVTRMKAAYPNRFYPPVLDLEQVLYTTALSEEDYSCEADFDDRVQRAIGLARQRRHAQARFPTVVRRFLEVTGCWKDLHHHSLNKNPLRHVSQLSRILETSQIKIRAGPRQTEV